MSNCVPCTSNTSSLVTLQSFNATYNNCGCVDGDCGCNGVSVDSKCVFYTGPNLPCAQIQTNNSLEDILIKVDQKLCTSIGNYATYNKGCLDDAGAITTEQEFVEAISSYVCLIRTDLTAFTATTYTTYQASVDTRFDAIETPGITCASAGVVGTDSLNTVLSKYCTAFTNIYSKLDLSTVSWDSCYTVSPDPITLSEAFNVIIGQICDIKDGAVEAALPVFNNTASCLAAPTSTDTLVNTIEKIKDRMCLSPTFDINALTWGCTTKPSTTTADLQGAVDAILAKLTILTQNSPTFNSSFVVTLTNGSDPCAGKTVALAATSILDKFVAVDGADTSPGTLLAKLTPGTGLAFDTTTAPGTIIINSTASAAVDIKVKTRSADPTAGFLEDKIEGSTGTDGVSTTTSTNTGNNKVTIGATVNFVTLWTKLLDALTANPALKADFCAMVQSCLPDCIIPPNVTVIYQDTNQTTTSTTTTTTTTL